MYTCTWSIATCAMPCIYIYATGVQNRSLTITMTHRLLGNWIGQPQGASKGYCSATPDAYLFDLVASPFVICTTTAWYQQLPSSCSLNKSTPGQLGFTPNTLMFFPPVLPLPWGSSTPCPYFAIFADHHDYPWIPPSRGSTDDEMH